MAVLVLPLVVGISVGLLLRGQMRTLVLTQLRGIWMLWLAAVVQVVQLRIGWTAVPVVFGLVLVWFGINLPARPRPAQFALVTALAGLVANGIAIAANGRMPYAPTAAVAAGLEDTIVTLKNGKHSVIP